MNKKFSTLVAGLLLATSIGTVGAQTPNFTMFENGQTGSLATTLKKEGAFQLSDAAGDKVLAMVKENGKYVLRMVAAGSNVKLAETLWTIRWTTYDDTVKKYYFTFESAAYHMPLSFSTENAGKDGFTADVNYEFPGKIATWEWQEGIEGDGIANSGAALKYRFANPDSVMTLAENPNNGKVGAVKYAQKQVFAGLALKPMTLNKVVLTADDLNSMMYTQSVEQLMKLTFNADVSEQAVANQWTNRYEAVEAMGENELNKAILAVIEAAQAAAEGVYSPAGVAEVVRGIDMTGYSDAQKAVVEACAVAAEAEGVKTFDEAVAAVGTVAATFSQDIADAQVTDANTLKNKFTADWIVATAAAFDAAVDGVSATSGADDLKAVYKKLKPATYNLVAAKEAALKQDGVYDAAKTKATEDKTAATTFSGLVGAISWSSITSKGTTAEIVSSFQGEIAKLTGSDKLKGEATKIAGDQPISGITENDYNTYVAAVAAAVLEPYTVASDKADANKTYSTNILAAINALKGLNTKVEYDAAVMGVTLTTTDAAKAEVQNTFKGLVEGEAYVVPTSAAQDAAVQVYTDKAAGMGDLVTAATAAKNAATAIDETTVADAIDVVTWTRPSDEGMDEADFAAALTAMSGAATSASDIAAAVTAVKAVAVAQAKLYPASYPGYISLQVPGTSTPYNYLRVDTSFITAGSGNKHLAFKTGVLNPGLKTTAGEAVATYVQHDFNARHNFQFTYFPTEDSLVINTPLKDDDAMIYKSAGFAHPLADVKYLDMTNEQIKASWALHTIQVGDRGELTPENIVKIVVLNDATKHREVTVGADEVVEATNADPATTLNTRIGFNVKFTDYVAIPAGVYTIKYVSNDVKNKDNNGRYITYNWLENTRQFMASVEDQELNHIPAAQWIVTQAKGESLNSIVNRESAQPLYFNNAFGQVQQQYVYPTATKDLYRTLAGDSLLFTAVPAEFTTNKTLGYFANKEANTETADELQVYALKYLNDLNDDLFVGYNEADSILNVAKTEADDMLYFRLIRATDSVSYGPAITKDENGNIIAEQLKHMAYYLQLETPNKNIKEEDKLFISEFKDGKYKLQTNSQNAKQAFFLKEFKEADTHYYALIEAGRNNEENVWDATLLGNTKISVKDYPSILVQEELEGENQSELTWGSPVDGRTSTFTLVAKDAPKYRRLGVTNPDDELNNMGTNVAKINITREDNRYLYENSINKVAGYEADPTGINYLGALFNGADKAALFIDTAYVRNETARPQYLLAVRPDFTPDTTFCPVDHGHPYELVDQVRANYLVTLSDSVAAYKGDKKMLEKFMYENRTYTRLAFVDAVHQGDELVIMSSKFKGTTDAAKDTIDLSKNAFNNAAVQFRLTRNDDQTAEFYIETQSNEFVRLINGVAVLTDDIADAERFNIAKTDDKPVANEGINASEVSVIAKEGAVVIKGAQGKKVAISNVLGQTVANTVITSSEATIAAPAGVVVVAVEGEAAVKAIVK